MTTTTPARPPDDRLETAVEERRFPVLSSWVSAGTIGDAVARIAGWIAARERRYVNLCTSDTILQCHDTPGLRAAVAGAGMAAPDGMPLVWLGRLRGCRVGRVYGPDLMLRVCAAGVSPGWRHFFYGSTDDVLADLEQRLAARFPGLVVAGRIAPPFRPLSGDEEKADAARINAARPDIVWVGLGTPKQDYWVARLRPALDAPVLIAVGAAFAFHAGHLRQAPRWMMRCGLEWLFRLAIEPRRLWRRYVIGNPRFMWLVAKQWVTGRPAPAAPGGGARE